MATNDLQAAADRLHSLFQELAGRCEKPGQSIGLVYTVEEHPADRNAERVAGEWSIVGPDILVREFRALA